MDLNTNKAIEFLLARGNLPILYWLKKDILEVPVDRENKNLQKYAKRIRILESQRRNGGWCKKRQGRHPYWEKTFYIVETLQNCIQLHNYGCKGDDPGVKKALEFLLSTQTKEGDFRGAYLNEYAPTYHALTLEILCRFGMDGDARVKKGFRWLINNKQDDGGWVIPYRTIDKKELKKRYNYEAQMKLEPVKANTKHSSSHLVTGMVLRAMSSSPTWKKHKEARLAGKVLIDRFFKQDKYEDRQEAFYWEELTFPFWATDILSSLDSLSRIGFSPEEDGIKKAMNWLMKKQNENGYWHSTLKKTSLGDHLWITLSVLRVLKQFGLLQI
jgi:hypothetical protein